jgi:hypothetical protein
MGNRFAMQPPCVFELRDGDEVSEEQDQRVTKRSPTPAWRSTDRRLPPVFAELLLAVLKITVSMQVGPDEVARLHVARLANLLEDVLRRCGTGCVVSQLTYSHPLALKYKMGTKRDSMESFRGWIWA